ncbi:MAG: hypothetical protein JXA96_16650 [Sedimentisphaerales bacterium]|nr:hypothetical protein [Sedimentisphaerales bacterium]
MDREIIERLAMDFSAGELNEDVQTLLQEYLAEHHEENMCFLQMQNIYRDTQETFNTITASFKQNTEKNFPIRFKWIPFIRLAAVIVISACIGIAAGRWSKQDILQQESGKVISNYSPFVKKSGLNLDDLGEGFWHNKITAMLNPSPAREHIKSKSGSSLLEQYKLYLKERNHE